MNAFLKRNALYLFAIGASLLLSFFISYHADILNSDGICYLLSAQIVSNASLNEAMQFCPQSKWPFYSILINSIVQITHFSYAIAAHLLEAFFSALSVLTFVFIVSELGGKGRVLWLSALTILCSHQFNNVKEYIIRDHGFWAFYLVSMWCLLRYVREPKLFFALTFSMALLIATLFRIEGALFLLGLPWLIWFDVHRSFKQRVKQFFELNLLIILMGIIVGIWMMMHPDYASIKLGRFTEIFYQFKNLGLLLTEKYVSLKAILTEHILPTYAKGDAGAVLFLTWISWYALRVVTVLSWIYSFLVLYAWWQKSTAFNTRNKLVLFGYIAINIIITLTFLAENLFLSKRYLMAFMLVLMVWVPFGLNLLINQATNLRRKLLLACLFIGIFGSALGGILDFGYSKSFILDASKWIDKKIPANAALYVNDVQVMYYSKHFGFNIFNKAHQYHQKKITAGGWKKFDYLVLRINAKETAKTADILRELAIPPIQIFSNKRGDRVVIYKISHKGIKA